MPERPLALEAGAAAPSAGGRALAPVPPPPLRALEALPSAEATQTRGRPPALSVGRLMKQFVKASQVGARSRAREGAGGWVPDALGPLGLQICPPTTVQGWSQGLGAEALADSRVSARRGGDQGRRSCLFPLLTS